MRTALIRASVVAAMAVGSAVMADVPWGNGMASGNASFFSWANGQDTNSNLFGTPTLVGDTFYFFPSNFVATSVDGVPGMATDTLSFDVIVHPNFKIDGIAIQEFGDYSINGQGSVDVQGVLNVSDAPHGALAPANMLFNPTFPAASGVNQNWSGGTAFDLTNFEGGVPFQVIHISITNTLVAISAGPGHSAVVRKTIVGDTMAITVLPEPGVLALVAMSGLLASRRRRA